MVSAQYNDQVKAEMNIERKLWAWSIDMWSLGVILIESVIGFPVWMSYKGRIVNGDVASKLITGVFGVQGRTPAKIASLQ